MQGNAVTATTTRDGKKREIKIERELPLRVLVNEVGGTGKIQARRDLVYVPANQSVRRYQAGNNLGWLGRRCPELASE